jgi:hypothetical protein
MVGRGGYVVEERPAYTCGVLVPRDCDPECVSELRVCSPMFDEVYDLAFALEPPPSKETAATKVRRSI